MTLVSLHRVERRFAETPVFSGVSIRIGEGDHLGIVGDNGEGKTTLLRVILGIDPPDAGERTARRDLRLAWTEQIPDLPPELTALDAVRAAFGDLEEIERKLSELERSLETDPEDRALLSRHGRLLELFEAGGGWDRERLAERALDGLGFSSGDRESRVGELSGGQKVRLSLARALLRPVDLLALDEPTNHLDLGGIAFLENTLSNRRGAFLVISHDRRFLDRVCGGILEVESGAVRRFKGGYEAYRRQKRLRLETELREFRKQEEFIAKEMDFIRRSMGGQRTKEAKGRLKRLQRLERIAKPLERSRRMAMRLGPAKGLRGQTVLEGEDLAFAFPGESLLFSGISLRIQFGERIGLVGRNGVGKSTLLRILEGARSPVQGRVERAKNLRIVRFDQEMRDLPAEGTVLSAISPLLAGGTEGEWRSHLARFLFCGDDVDKKIEHLSGGEKRRLHLARFVLEPADLLLLDEPTNHLDISTREVLEECIRGYEGTVVAVSHDRWFLEECIDRILELTPEGVVEHRGGLEEMERLLKEKRARTGRKETPRNPPGSGNRSSTGRGEGTKIRNPWAFAKLEEEIIVLEEEAAGLDALLASEGIWKEPERLKEIRARKEEIGRILSDLYERWENWQ